MHYVKKQSVWINICNGVQPAHPQMKDLKQGPELGVSRKYKNTENPPRQAAIRDGTQGARAIENYHT